MLLIHTLLFVMQKKVIKKRVARKLDVKDLRRSERTKTLRCRNIKGPGSDSTQPMVIDDEDPEDQQMVGEDPHKVGECLGTLRDWSDIARRLTQ
jgi:hypothetical protein